MLFFSFEVSPLKFILLLFLVFYLAFPAFAQISPGDLTTAHSKLEGMSNCTKCHELGEAVTNRKCLDCHKEINSHISNKRGYHASNEVRGKDCWSCHSEHNGRNFKIIRFDKKGFDHKKTGFELTGKHGTAKCEDCHKKDFITDQKLKNKKNTYLGLTTDCSGCHEDVHQGTLEKNCSGCHNTSAFKPAVLFSHDRAKFKLTGSHVRLGCFECHATTLKNNKQFTLFRDIKHQSCENCHKDIHDGKFGKDCTKCHNTSSFKSVNTSEFNHSRTAFPLIGKHASVNCNDCHGKSLSSKPKFALCTDCHEDEHNEELIKNNKVENCESCHSVNGFSPSLFTIERHNEGKFVLTGGHLGTPCNSCHYKSGSWRFRKIGEKCSDCHTNVHGEEISDVFLVNNDCMTCHETGKWLTINFNHDRTEFKLIGRHADVECKNCHIDNKEQGRKIYLFKSLNSSCQQCHKDKHAGQFAENGLSDCSRCHGFENWKAEKFDHNKTKFVLTGAHEKVHCSGCHKEVQIGVQKVIQYKSGKTKCVDCHS